MRRRCPTAWPVHLAAVLAAAPSARGQEAPTRFEDPASPEVHELDAIEPPAPQDHPQWQLHQAPKPLDERSRIEDWPGFLGPRRDSHSRETRLLKEWPEGGPRLVWEMRCGQGYSSPVVRGERLVFTHRTGGREHIECLRATTGRRYWRVSYPVDYKDRYISDGGPRSTPVIDGDRVYVHGVEGVLHCLDLATGRLVWKRNTTEEWAIGQDFFGVVSSPIVVGDLLIQNIGAPNGPSVAAFDKATGRLVWGCGTKWGASCASPVLGVARGRPRLFVLAGGDSRPPSGGLMVLDPATGTLDFRYPFRSRRYESVLGSSPVVGRDWVFISSSYGVGSAVLSLESGGGFKELWRSRRVGLQFSNAVLHDGHLYAIDGHSDRAGAIICVEPATGRELSRTDLSWDESIEIRGENRTVPFSIGEGSLLHADGDFLCLGDNGHLLWLDVSPQGTKVRQRAWLFRANTTWTPPALSRGLLYVRQTRRERFGVKPARLLCYDLRRGGD